MHFGDHIARHRTGGGVGRPVAGIRVAFGQRFGDGNGFADHLAVGQTHRRHLPRRGIAGEHLIEVIGVEDAGFDFDGNPEFLEQQPAAQRPAGIGAVADGEIIGHGGPVC